MPGSLGHLNINLSLDSVQFSKGLNKAKQGAVTFANVTNKSLNSIEQNVQRLNKSVSFADKLFSGNLFVAMPLRNITSLADTYTEIGNRMKLVTSSSVESARAMQAVFDISAKTRQGLNGTAQVYQRFAQNANRLGINQERVAELTEIVSKAVAISGASASSAEAALTQFGQSLASGVFRGDEFNSVMEQTPGLALAIANGLGVTSGELRQMAADGKLSMDVIIPALEKMKDVIDKDFDGMLVPISQSFKNMQTAATKWIGEADKSIGVSNIVSNAILTIADNFDFAAKSALGLAAAFALFKSAPKMQGFIENCANLYNEQQFVAIQRQKVQALASVTKASLQQQTVEYQALKLRSDNLIATQRQIVAEQQLIAIQIQGATVDVRSAGFERINALKAEEIQINKMLSVTEKELLTSKAALKTAYAQNAITQSAAAAGTVRSNIVLNAYRATVRAATAELTMMKVAFMSNPILFGGIIATTLLSFAGYWFDTAQATEEATQKAKDYAKSVEISEESLNKMSVAALRKQQQDLEDSRRVFEQNIAEKQRKVAELNAQLVYLNNGWANYGVDSWYSLKSQAEQSAEIQRELVNIEAELDSSRQDLSDTTDKLTDTQGKLDERLGTGAQQLPNIANKALIFSGTLADLGLEADIAKDKLQAFFDTLYGKGTVAIQNGNNVAAYAADKLSEQYFKDIKNLKHQREIAGLKGEALHRANATKEAADKGYVKAHLARDNVKSKKSGKKEKSFADWKKDWDSFHDEIQRSNASAMGTIDLNQLRMFKQLSEYESKGVMTAKEAADAKLQIEQRYIEERLALAGQYNQAVAADQRYKKAKIDIEELRKGGLLTRDQADTALSDAGWQHWKDTRDKSDLQTAPFDGMKVAIHDFGKEAEDVMGNVANITQRALGGMADALTDFVMTGKADFRGFAQSVIRDTTNMIIKMMILNSLKAAFGDTSFGKFMGWGQTAARGGLIGSLQVPTAMFDTGGYTGHGNRLTPAGIVHKGEYVLTKEATSRIGRDYLDFLNYAGSRGFATGGGVAVPKVPNVHVGGRSPKVSVKVINNGEPTQAEVSTKQNQQGELEITVELMRQIAKSEANAMIQNNFRAGGAFT